MEVPSVSTALVAIARLTLRRVVRGRGLWLAIAFGALPLVYASMSAGKHRAEDELLGIEMLVLCVTQPLLVAASIGEEIEDRTTTYLWSRPLPRWTVLVGKLVALAPIGAALSVVSMIAAYRLEYDVTVPALNAGALAIGAIAIGAIVAGIATFVPKHGMALAIVYLTTDLVVGNIHWSLQEISITHHVVWFFWHQPLGSAIALAIIPGVWLALGLVRVRRLEA